MPNLPLVAAAAFMTTLVNWLPAATIVVPGTSNPWLSGMPNGSAADFGDLAPAQSPILFAGISLVAGTTLQFTVAGSVFNGAGGTTDGPDGGAVFSHSVGAENGIADTTAPINSLIGVFLSANQPSLTLAPSAFVNFPTAPTISPGLKQPFFIGDGLTGTGTGTRQQFIVPAGATRLFLGTMDGFTWSNNSGAFTVTTVPEPGTLTLAAFGLSVLLWRRTRRRQ